MTSGQSAFPCVAPMFRLERFGKHGTYVDTPDISRHTAGIVDDIAIGEIKVHTEAINHDPAITYIHHRAPSNRAGRAWGPFFSYGLGASRPRTCPPSSASP